MALRLWEPSKNVIEQANITRFIAFINQSRNLQIKTYKELYEWSIENIPVFWELFWEFSGIIASKPYSRVVDDLESFPPKTKWFPGATLNFAQNLLRYKDDQIALIAINEEGEQHTFTYKELHDEVSRVYSSLKAIGVGPGDRVGGYLPNIALTVIAMLATTALGATWSSCGSELGPKAALDRLGQIEPKVLFTVDGYVYKGKYFDQLAKAKEVATGIPSLEKIIVYKYIKKDVTLDGFKNAVFYSDFKAENTQPIDFTQVPFDHPLYIMFSSGTTGKPKCMVQSVGGVLINHLKELILHTDLKREDNLMYLTSPSWMMWNWLISGLGVGATIILFDGNPLYPDWRKVFQLIDHYRITIFGCSASYLQYLKTVGAIPKKEFDLASLREISQTGSALSEEGFQYVYEAIKQDLHFNSISGGTDINGCFAAGSPTLPVYAGQLQARALAMKVKAYDDNGNEIYDQQGELVCELPAPSMPIYFWNDPENKKYQNAYFNYFKNKHVWRHGDYIVIHSDTGGVTFYGRSDSVLKPSGVRIGTAEIYNIVEELPEIEDSLAIGQAWKGDQRIILFVKLKEDLKLTDELQAKIKNELRTKASPRHVPAIILQAPDIPYTFSGKKVESAITNIIHDKPVTNKDALRNPQSLEYYEKIKAYLQQA